MESSRLKSFIGYSVVFGWLIALLYGIASGEYEPLRDVTPIMLPVVGFMFSDHVFGRRDDK